MFYGVFIKALLGGNRLSALLEYPPGLVTPEPESLECQVRAMLRTRLTELLGIERPIVLAGMNVRDDRMRAPFFEG